MTVDSNRWYFNKTDFDGEVRFHSGSPDFFWTTAPKMTIYNQSGQMVLAAELGRKTDYDSGNFRFRKDTSYGYVEHYWKGMNPGEVYTVCIEGYF